MNDLVSVVRAYSDSIKNDRTVEDILEYLHDEVSELDGEVIGYDRGEDGIPGEAVDVILCALDLIYKSAPHWTDADIIAYAQKKCQKWAKKYG